MEPPIPKILSVVFHLQTSGLVCSNFVYKQINNIVQDNSVNVTETYFTVFLWTTSLTYHFSGHLQLSHFFMNFAKRYFRSMNFIMSSLLFKLNIGLVHKIWFRMIQQNKKKCKFVEIENRKFHASILKNHVIVPSRVITKGTSDSFVTAYAL